MDHPLIEFLSRYVELSPNLERSILASSLFEVFPKGTVLLRQGEPVRRAYLVLKGCVRGYVLKGGLERTVDFFTEEESILPIGYGRGAAADQSLVCMEETTAVVSTVEQEQAMMREYPELRSVCLTMAEVMAEKLKDSMMRLQTSSPEERYLYLRECRPDLLQRVPQYYIASYLGIQPESLSRIRRRLCKQPVSAVRY